MNKIKIIEQSDGIEIDNNMYQTINSGIRHNKWLGSVYKHNTYDAGMGYRSVWTIYRENSNTGCQIGMILLQNTNTH